MNGYFLWGDHGLMGFGTGIPFRLSPTAFTSLGGEFRIGGAGDDYHQWYV